MLLAASELNPHSYIVATDILESKSGERQKREGKDYKVSFGMQSQVAILFAFYQHLNRDYARN